MTTAQKLPEFPPIYQLVLNVEAVAAEKGKETAKLIAMVERTRLWLVDMTEGYVVSCWRSVLSFMPGDIFSAILNNLLRLSY